MSVLSVLNIFLYFYNTFSQISLTYSNPIIANLMTDACYFSDGDEYIKIIRKSSIE